MRVALSPRARRCATVGTMKRMRTTPLAMDPQGHWVADRGEIGLFHLYVPANFSRV